VSDVLNGAAHRGYGRAYLEKIVQAHVHVPVPAEDKMEEQLRTGITSILEAAGAEVPASLSARTRVLHRIVRTPRDLGRYLNGLRILTLARTTWDLDSTDALHLAALHVFYPEVYERVRRSKSYLTNGRDGAHDEGLRPRSLDWLLAGENDRADDPEAEEAADLLHEMFGDYGTHQSPGSSDPSLDDRRIASAEVFNAYFTFGAEPEWIPRARVRTCIERLVEAAQTGNRDGFRDLLEGIGADRRFFAALTRSDLVSALSSLEPSEAVLFAEFLLDLKDFEGEKWMRIWDAYMSSTHKLVRQHQDYDVIRQLSAPVDRWIESAPDAAIKTARSRMYTVSD
jgi:hypothetical protein